MITYREHQQSLSAIFIFFLILE